MSLCGFEEGQKYTTDIMTFIPKKHKYKYINR